MDLQLADRVYIVTGGTAGLGGASATALVAEGARVVISGRRQDRLDAAAARLGPLATTVLADNADPATPGRLLAAAQEFGGRVDGALISVGGPPPGTVMNVSDDAWTAGFETVFLGGVRLCREIAAELKPGGALALVLSSSVKSPVAGLAISNGLRPGLAMMAKNLADELGSAGVRVNGLLPGRIATERLEEIDRMGGDPEASKAAACAAIPMGRYGDPEEFGRVAAFLLSPVASYLTGVMLPVDGGMARSF